MKTIARLLTLSLLLAMSSGCANTRDWLPSWQHPTEVGPRGWNEPVPAGGAFSDPQKGWTF